MISKNDIILLLTEMSEQGEDVTNDLKLVLNSDYIPFDVLKKINESKPLDVLKFYEKLRKSYNAKKSKLYINIVKIDENLIEDPKTVLTTASALLNQLLQFNAEDKTLFYSHSRADEIVKVLEIYFKTYNISPIVKLLHLVKADLKCLEEISK